MSSKLPRRTIPFLLALNLATFGITFWSSVTNPNLFQYKLTRLAPPNVVNSLLGLFSIGGLLVATFAQPLMGTFSDRTRSRFGRRAPYLVLGALGLVLAAFATTSADSLAILLLTILFGSLCSNTVQGPFQALSPDQVPDEQKGLSAGFKTIFELLAVLTSGIVIQQILAKDQLGMLAWVLAAIILVTALVTAFAVPDRGSGESVRPQADLRASLRRIATPEYRNLRWWLLNRYLFWAGLVALRQFILNYLQDVGGYSNSGAQALSGQFTILLGVGVVLITLPAGLLSDRLGRTRLIALSGLIAFLSALVLMFVREATALQIVAILAGGGVGMYFSINWALVTSLVPAQEAALFLGIANIATTLGSSTGQLGGPLIDAINGATHTTNGYFILFGLAALFFLLSAGVITRIVEGAPAEPGAPPLRPLEP